MINALLIEAIELEPPSLFLYTWRFIEFLQKEERNTRLKQFYVYFAPFTILALPAVFYSVFVAKIIVQSKYEDYFQNGDLKKLTSSFYPKTDLIKRLAMLH